MTLSGGSSITPIELNDTFSDVYQFVYDSESDHNDKRILKTYLEKTLEVCKPMRVFLSRAILKRDKAGRKIVRVGKVQNGGFYIDINGQKFTFDVTSNSRPRPLNISIKLFSYQPTPESPIQKLDNFALLSLNPGAYVNDDVINFYFSYLFEIVMGENMRSRSHVFLSFFYTRLLEASKSSPKGRKTGHELVAGWTKRIDIFSKDYLFIPILENDHWFLSIVCFPWLCGTVDYDERFSRSQRLDDTSLNLDDPTIPTSLREMRKERLKRLTDEGFEPMPCVMIFDSLTGDRSKKANVGIIREFLQTEWNIKQRPTFGPLAFNKTTLRGYSPLVTYQNNSYDCGLYCLAYAEYFIRNPLKRFSKKVLLNQKLSPEVIEGHKLRADLQDLIICEFAKSRQTRNST